MSLLFKPSYSRFKKLMRERPEDAADWSAIQSETLLLAECGGNLTTRRGDAIASVADDYWTKNSNAVRNHGAELYDAAKEKDFEAATRSYRAMIVSMKRGRGFFCAKQPTDHASQFRRKKWWYKKISAQ